MTIQEYFGDWARFVNLEQADSLIKKLAALKQTICPNLKDIFRAFKLCSLDNLKVVVVGMDPYPTIRDGRPVATGIAFANQVNTLENDLSPSLKILKESVIDYTIPHGIVNFDCSLEEWEKQGVLLINSALTCQLGRPGSHSLMWYPFIKDFLTNLSKYNKGIVYVLMGSDAKSFESFIDKEDNYVLCTNHPSYYARTRTRMPSDIWKQINDILIKQYDYRIEWYKEESYE